MVYMDEGNSFFYTYTPFVRPHRKYAYALEPETLNVSLLLKIFLGGLQG